MTSRSDDSFEIAIKKFDSQGGYENFPKIGTKQDQKLYGKRKNMFNDKYDEADGDAIDE